MATITKVQYWYDSY